MSEAGDDRRWAARWLGALDLDEAPAADVLRALGLDRDPAHERVGRAAQAALG